MKSTNNFNTGDYVICTTLRNKDNVLYSGVAKLTINKKYKIIATYTDADAVLIEDDSKLPRWCNKICFNTHQNIRKLKLQKLLNVTT